MCAHRPSVKWSTVVVVEKLRELLADAFRDVPAREANEAIAAARMREGRQLRSYEIVLSTWEVFASEQVPKLVYHLESVGAHLPECRGVIVSAFLGERLYFVEASALVARVCRMLGVTADQLVERHGTGERRTAIRDPLLLPGPNPGPKGRN